MNGLLKKITAVILCLIILAGVCINGSVCVEAKTNGLSKKEKNYYAKVIRYKLWWSAAPILDGAKSIYLEDLNNDGRKEFIISGFWGVRNVSSTVIYYYDGKKFHHKVLDGELLKKSKNKFYILSGNYDGSGEVYYYDSYVYSMDKKGNIVKILAEKEKYISESGKSYAKYYKRHNGKMQRVNQKRYKKAFKSFKMKKIKEISEADLKKIFR